MATTLWYIYVGAYNFVCLCFHRSKFEAEYSIKLHDMEHIFSLYRCGRAYDKERRVPRIYPTYNIYYSWSQDLSKRLSFYRHARLEWEYKYLECDGSEKKRPPESLEGFKYAICMHGFHGRFVQIERFRCVINWRKWNAINSEFTESHLVISPVTVNIILHKSNIVTNFMTNRQRWVRWGYFMTKADVIKII